MQKGGYAFTVIDQHPFDHVADRRARLLRGDFEGLGEALSAADAEVERTDRERDGQLVVVDGGVVVTG